MALNDTQTKVHLDAATDDPKQARGELQTNVDIYNAMVALLKTIATLNIGDGVKDDGSGNLDLGTNPGLQIIASQLLAKVGTGNKLTSSGIETDINGLTTDASPDIAADFVPTYDVSAGVLKKVLIKNLAGYSTFISAEQTLSTAGSFTLAHSLSGKPQIVQIYLRCKTAELNYSIGDEVLYDAFDHGAASRGFQTVPDATNVVIRQGSATTINLLNKTTGAEATITYGNWKMVVKAVYFA